MTDRWTYKCAFCGHPDKRHRIVDAILERTEAGEDYEEVLHDYGWSPPMFALVRQQVAEAEAHEKCLMPSSCVHAQRRMG